MAKKDNSFQHQEVTKQQAIVLLEKEILKTKEPINKAYLQTKTGLSIFLVEDALTDLMEKYPCRLTVNDKGQIFYHFDTTRNRTKTTFQDKIKKIIRFSSLLFIFILKLWIALMFIIYGGFYGLIITIILIGISGNIQAIVLWGAGIYEAFKLLFYDVREVFLGNPKPPTKKKSLIEYVFEFALGQRHIKEDALTLERKIVDYIQNNRCKITASEVSMITGWTLQKAEEEMTLLMTHYRGKVYVTDEGAIIYDFPEFEQKTFEKQADNNKFYCWNNPVPFNIWKMGEKGTPNKIIKWVIGFFITVGFIGKFLGEITFKELGQILRAVFTNPSLIGDGEYAGIFFLILLPWLFFGSFLLISNITRMILYRQNETIRKQNERYKFIFNICNKNTITLNDVPKRLSTKEKHNLIFDYNGESFIDEDAKIHYRFNQINNELKYVNRERNLTENFTKEAFKNYDKSNQKNVKFKNASFLAAVKVIILLGLAFPQYSLLIIQPIVGIQLLNPVKDNEIIDMKLEKYQKLSPEKLSRAEYLTFTNVSHTNPMPLRNSMHRLKKLTIKNSQSLAGFPEYLLIDSLIIKNCTIDSFPISFNQKWTHLQYLEIDSTPLKIVPKGIENLEDIKKIKITNAGLTTFPGRFKNMRYFSIDFSHNQITTFEDNCFGEEFWSLLNLSHNNLKELPEGLKSIYVYDLYLTDNQLTNFELLSKNPQISHLYLDNNQISKIPDSISEMRNLKILSLNNNQVKEIPKGFYLVFFNELHLNNNPLKELPEWLGRKPNLKVLSIGGCTKIKFYDSFKNISERYTDVYINKDDPEDFKQKCIKYFGKNNVKYNEMK